MPNLRPFVRFLSALVLGALLSTAAIAAQKFDNSLASALVDAQKAKEQGLVTSKRAGTIEALLRVQGNALAELANLDVTVRSQHGDIVTVDIPTDRLNAVVALETVIYAEASRRKPTRLATSVALTRANELWTRTNTTFGGNAGQGVIVGIVDDGFDFRHRDFRNADGSTRLLALFDQRTAATGLGTPAQGFNYGQECSAADMNAVFAGEAARCTQPSTGGHGTHVGGIAVGNGSATGNGQPAFRHIGVAPAADILSANSIVQAATGGGVLDGIAWMKAKAKAAGKPLVINLSLGSYYGPRDGTSNFERGMSNAGEAGVILVAAAGNEGNVPIRAVSTVRSNETTTVTLNMVAAGGSVEMWYPGTHAYGISVKPDNCPATVVVGPGQNQVLETACGGIEINHSAPQANNDDRQVTIRFFAPTDKPLTLASPWEIRVTGSTVPGGSAPISMICGETGEGLTFASNTEPVTRGILTDTASATRNIAVAASVNPTGAMAAFSSRGPRRDCSNLQKCPRIMKPEITAPGESIVAAMSQDYAGNRNGVDPDGVHLNQSGTSMATPHVAGAVALLLQRNPSLTPEAVKALLFTNTIQPNTFVTGLPVFDANVPVPANPNDAWGYGAMDVKRAFDATPQFDVLGDSDGDGIPNGIEGPLGRNPNLKDNDIFGNSRLFVMQMYRDFLTREGDAGGVNFWVGRIDRNERSRAQMAEEYVNSNEFQGRIAPIVRLQFAINRAIPAFASVFAQVAQRDAGTSLEAIGRATLAASPLAGVYNGRAEAEFIATAYTDLLGRAPTGAENAAAVAAIASVGRGGFLAQLANTQEYATGSANSVYVTMMYMGMLRRGPEQGGFDFWVGVMRGGQSGLGLVQAFLDAAEYRNRFLPPR
jgi:subtilisin family serine protease